ncbi:MAG TPA: hypothetical protein VGD43_01170, partial [Micromonospora sp.]
PALTAGGSRGGRSEARSAEPAPAAKASPVAVVDAPVVSALEAPTQALPIRQPGQRHQPQPAQEENAPPPAPGSTVVAAGQDAPPPLPQRPTKPAQPASYTPSGLPFRVRQANLAQPLRAEEPTESGQTQDVEEPTRPPEQIRRIMSSYQTGTRRGRTDAARLLGAEDTDAEVDEPKPEPVSGSSASLPEWPMALEPTRPRSRPNRPPATRPRREPAADVTEFRDPPGDRPTPDRWPQSDTATPSR